MTSTNPSAAALSSEQGAELDALLAAFERDWRDGLLSEAALQLSDRAAEFRRAALVAMTKIDLKRQWQGGRRLTLEDYLRSFPDLGGANGVPTELIEVELEIRAASGEVIEASSVFKRFPGRATELGTLVGRDDTRQGSGSGGIPSARPLESAGDFRHGSGVVPEEFGRYRIQRRLGRGGMGAVYLAFDSELHRSVALKIPSREARSDPVVVERLLREARAAAGLRHPNICPVYDVGRHDDTPYITMAYIEGKTLQEELHSGKSLSANASAALVRKLALAIEEAHRRGLLHRDLKPSNIMIDPSGEPVVMDFGLVRTTDAADDHLTQAGMILGTPAYMAPEQAKSEMGELGPATDVYSAGVILYQLLAGRLPFTGNVHSLLLQTIHDDPLPPSQIKPSLDPGLEAVCLRALAKRPADRYTSMAEFAAALQSCGPRVSLAATSLGGVEALPTPQPTSNRPDPEIKPRRRRSRKPVVVATAAAVVCGVALAAGLLGSRSGVSSSGREPAEPATATTTNGARDAKSQTNAPTDKSAPAGNDAGLSDLIDIDGQSRRATRPTNPDNGTATKNAVESGGARHGKE
jgi:serine/threonine protein kinase